ncbi:hypothetical protein GWI33_012046 [Rhynchophorus ferrugineus]|uniref:Uncharacterized protein n=1 Tax=Rhynchophorus ferrugineus TaxID=354439 RepID=A0A834IC61_RHYFE|nr:hypothetical protein GWI33_012046 [Rhynchophorus ferrugineus]
MNAYATAIWTIRKEANRLPSGLAGQVADRTNPDRRSLNATFDETSARSTALESDSQPKPTPDTGYDSRCDPAAARSSSRQSGRSSSRCDDFAFFSTVLN